MVAKKKKFYAVKAGRKSGIYETWEECEKQTKGFPGAEYKSFKRIEEAEEFLNSDKLDERSQDPKDIDYNQLVKDDLREGYVVAFTDGSHNPESSHSSYGIHLTIPDNSQYSRIEEVSSRVHTQKFSQSNNIVGEVFGVINALDWCLKNEFEKASIFCDYQGLIEWENGNWKAKTQIAKFYIKKINEYKVMLDVKFTWVKGHSKVSQNENADLLAKNVLKGKRQKFKTGKNYFTGEIKNIHEIDNIISTINNDIEIETVETEVNAGLKRTVKYEKEKLHVTFYPTKRTLLVQGAPGYLYSLFLTYYSDSLEAFNIVRTYSDAYESTIKTEYVEKTFNDLNLPQDYPRSYKILVRQAISSLWIKEREEYDYGHYTVPAYRVLEGHLRYLFEKAGHHLEEKSNIGGQFNKKSDGRYFLTNKKVRNHENKKIIEDCYNHYFYERHPQLHTGEIGIIDNTKLITTLDDAKEEIREVLALLQH